MAEKEEMMKEAEQDFMQDTEDTTSEDETMMEDKEEDIAGTNGAVKKKVVKKGSGWQTPEKGFEVKVHYVGKLLDGTTFDSSRDRDEPFTFTLGTGGVIQGWEKGVATMKKGETSLFTIAPEYAYGKAGSPPKIPPDATLQFEIELLDWIEEKDISEDDSRTITKRILTEGDGWEKPKDDSKVTANFVGKLADGTVFEEKQGYEWVVGAEQVIPGLDQAVKHMKKGEKAVVTIAPQHAYGATGNEGLKIGPNETLKYEIELKEFTKEKEKWEMSREEKFETALKRKDDGNMLFSQGKLERACKKYKAALDLFEYDDAKEDKEKVNKLKLPCYLNIAACKLKAGKLKEVKENCTKALEIDGNNVKALFRHAVACSDLGDWEDAKRGFTKALELDPHNADVRKEFQKLKARMSEQDKKDKALFAKMFQGKATPATETVTTTQNTAVQG